MDKPKSLSQRLEDVLNALPEAVATGNANGIFSELHRLVCGVALLESDWRADHDERIRLEERVKALQGEVVRLNEAVARMLYLEDEDDD